MKKMPPELVAQLIDPANASLSAGSNTKVQWRCTIDSRHTWWASPNTRSRGSGCPICSHKIVVLGLNDLATTHPELAAEFVDPAVGQTVHAGSHKKVEWSCEHDDHPSWTASVVSRVRSGSGCPYCSGRKAIQGVNDLATLYPEYAATLVNPGDAIGVTPRSGKKLYWRCSCCEHEWKVSPHIRLKADVDKGCPKCSGSKRWVNRDVPARGLVKDEHPEVMKDAVDPEYVGSLTSGSGIKVQWNCECGHTFDMAVRKKIMGQQCPICSGKIVVPGVNDLMTTHPEIARQAVDKDSVRTVSQGSEKVIEWQCDDGHTWDAPVYARVAGNGCIQCSGTGTSKIEKQLFDAVSVLYPEAQSRVVVNSASYGRVEFDIVAGDLAIEVNGLYWHSETTGKPRTYHADKVRAAAECGYQLIHVWEDQLRHNPEIIVRLIAYKLYALDKYVDACAVYGITDVSPVEVYHGRTLRCDVVNNAAAEKFLRNNHIQGYAVATHHYGLFAGEELVALLSVVAPGRDGRMHRREGQWEIRRFATSGVVRGGFSKLLAYAERDLVSEGLASWVTFSAHDVSQGELYAACGFVRDAELEPDYWYTGGIVSGMRVNKQSFQKKRFRDDARLVFDESWTEKQAAKANKLYRIYDAGKTRWMKSC